MRKLQQGDSRGLAPSMYWPAPIVDAAVSHDRGPVMVTIEYRIDTSGERDSVATLDQLSEARRRDGAYAWGLVEDAAQPGRFLEYFLVASWLEHLRQHERATLDDRNVQQQALAFHIGDTPPLVQHFLAPAVGRDKPSGS